MSDLLYHQLQADMHKLIMEMRKVVMNNSEHIDAERQEMV